MQMDFTEGAVGRKLLIFSLPIMASMLLHTAYNITDTIFVGMLGANELAAVSLAFPVVFIFIALASGLGIGANALISQAIGRKNTREASNFSEHALVIGVVMGVFIAAFGILFSPALFVFMGADAFVLPLAESYANIVFIGMIFMFVWFVSDSILRAEGNSKTPMYNLAFSVALNIVLDPILIFGLFGFPAMGVIGAAITTVFSLLIAAIANLAYIYTPKSSISLSLKSFKPNAGCTKRMIAVGLPASASQTLSAGGFILLMAVVGSFGTFAIAAYGIGIRINSVAILPLVGMSAAVMSFVGQNIGAGKPERAIAVSLLAAKMTFAMSAVFTIAVLAFPEAIARVFTQDSRVIEIALGYLSIVPFAFLFYGLYFALIGAFQGAGKTQLALAANSAYWIAAVAIAYFLSQTMGLAGVWIAMVIAGAIELAIVAAIFWSGVWLKGNKVM